MALVVAGLRALPWVELRLLPAVPGGAYLPLGYIPKDWLAYVAMIRQPGDTGNWLLANPFTTEPQEGRFILLFHQILGAVRAATGSDPFWLLEFSRLPLLLLFFAVLWRFLRRVLVGRRECLWAAGLVAFSGGLEPLALRLASTAMPATAPLVAQDLWHLYGWSSFGAFYNPLWIAGLVLLLLTLPPLLEPGGPRGWRQFAGVGVGMLLLGLTHTYSAGIAVAAVAGVAGTELVFDPGALRARLPRLTLALATPLLLLLLIANWQLQDPVFRASAGGLLGPQAPSLFWYPITFGAVGFFALRGLQRWGREAHPWRFVIGGWLAGGAFLATSTLLNGYHFIFGMHIPLCIAAAPALVAWIDVARGAGIAGRLRLVLVAVLLFLSPVVITLNSLAEAPDASLVPSTYLDVASELRGLPPTLVLAAPELGNLIPALTPHRVWIGHWFMTPDFGRRSAWYLALVTRPEAQARALRALVVSERLGALVVPASLAPRIIAILGPAATATGHGDLAVVRLRQGS
jgi:hypothetical protein